MFCVRCGTPLPEGAAYCSSCGTPVAVAAAALPPGPFPTPGATAAPATAGSQIYGGFWRRFWSYVIDRFILGVVFTPVGLVVLMPMMATESIDWTDTDLPAETLTALLGAILTVAK